ncbi:MAG: DUF5060 domain-containing protein [Planctomycetota bacterium]
MSRMGGMAAIAACVFVRASIAGDVSGPLVAWQTLTIDYAGPASGESADPNPFLDARLQVIFRGPDGLELSVPGYFAGDGDGGASGDVWRVRFTPPAAGPWTATASIRTGSDVAIATLPDGSPDPEAGTPFALSDAGDTFTVAPPDTGAPGFLAKGPLAYAGGFYLRFADGDYYLKGGVDSPENWLGYYGFDNTESDNNRGPGTPDRLHRFPTHAADWNPGDPDWDSPDTPEPNDGRRIIGALNYLESVGANSIYFLPMNIGGDAQDTWPYVGPINGSGAGSNDNTRFDLSKLEQWELAFAHAQRRGIKLHFVLNEAEAPNKEELDDAELGTERRLFYREMIARFAHHNAMQWNISEEYNLNLNLGVERPIDWAAFIQAQDPYDRPTTVHNAGGLNGNPNTGPWGGFIGEDVFDLTSLQWARNTTAWGGVVERFREATAASGRPIAIVVDEPGSITRDVPDFDAVRKRMLWDIYLSGSAGVEWFINDQDQSLEDFRDFDKVWRETTIARRFVEDNLPFWLMEPNDGLASGESGDEGGAEVFARIDGAAGDIYAVYFPDASPTGSLDLTGSPVAFRASWFNPRSGAFEGSFDATGGQSLDVPAPPSSPGEDWVLLLESGGCSAADLTQPFGVIGQADVAAFVDGFFANDSSAAQLALPFGVVSQADVAEFVRLFFEGCAAR